MDFYKLILKLYADDRSGDFDAKDVVPVFHSWIQTRAVPDHLLIDVADYTHVPDGPGVVLVAHEANFYLDRIDGRLGLTYSRKRPLDGTFADRLRVVITAALEAAGSLEESTSLRFRADQLTFKVNDRLLGPNSQQTFDVVRPELERLLLELYGEHGKFHIDHHQDPRHVFGVNIAVSGATVPDLDTLLARLGSAQLASD
jgi:hypothetical protein